MEGLLYVIGSILVILKLIGLIDWGWEIVTAPIYLPIIGNILVMLLFLIAAAVVSLWSKIKGG